MKLYVCYEDYGAYEGCSEPSEVFKKEVEALRWVAENPYARKFKVFDL